MKRVDTQKLSAEEQSELAWDKLLRSCSACEQSSAKIRRKLLDAGFSLNIVNAAISRAEELSFIDDVRYCECLIRSARYSGKGLRRVLKEIEDLGIDKYDLEAYTEYATLSQEEIVEGAVDVLRRHPPRSKDIRAGAYRKLVSKGFDFNIVSAAVRQYMQEVQDAKQCGEGDV